MSLRFSEYRYPFSPITYLSVRPEYRHSWKGYPKAFGCLFVIYDNQCYCGATFLSTGTRTSTSTVLGDRVSIIGNTVSGSFFPLNRYLLLMLNVIFSVLCSSCVRIFNCALLNNLLVLYQNTWLGTTADTRRVCCTKF